MAGIAPVADAVLASTVSAAERLVARATAHGLAVTLDQLGDIDIPEPAAARIDQAQLRALATLYLSADLESAGIVPAVEALAGLASTGALTVDLGGAAPSLADWWRGRHERLRVAERHAFFSRLFGTAPGPVSADAAHNAAFEPRMLELCEALYKLDEVPSGAPYGGTAQQTRVRGAARNLAENLGDAGGGSTAFMAGEIINTIRQALAIIAHPDLRGAFAARDVWGVVAGIGRVARMQFDPPAPYVRRGKAGMSVIAWLADASGGLGGQAALVSIGDPVVGSAVDWIEATLTIGEAAPAATPPRQAPPASPWSAIGA